MRRGVQHVLGLLFQGQLALIIEQRRTTAGEIRALDLVLLSKILLASTPGLWTELLRLPFESCEGVTQHIPNFRRYVLMLRRKTI